MALSDKLIMSDETAKGLVNGIKVGGFWGRMVVYLMLYVPLVFIFAMINGEEYIIHLLGLSQNFFLTLKFSSKPIFIFAKFFTYFVPLMLPFILVEWRIRSWRRKNGLSVYGNIAEELRQREVDIYVAREEKARDRMGNSNNTKDLEYWIGLLEKGAITKEQYDVKRDAILESK